MPSVGGRGGGGSGTSRVEADAGGSIATSVLSRISAAPDSDRILSSLVQLPGGGGGKMSLLRAAVVTGSGGAVVRRLIEAGARDTFM